jgi:hypothetical protein
MKVLTTSEVKEYLNDLVTILYQKEYFGFRESARIYAVELLDDIVANLPTRLHKSAPEYFDRYGKGMYYASFKKNKQTMWYAFFTKYQDETVDTIYLVKYIANNHTIAQHL